MLKMQATRKRSSDSADMELQMLREEEEKTRRCGR
jgi:hypothetical protein